MKKVLASVVLIGFMVVPAAVLAIEGMEGVPGTPGWGTLNVIKTLNSITNYLFGGLMIVAAIAIIIAGYFFVTAAGDPDKTKTARNFVLYAFIGVLVAFLARGLIYLVEQIVK